MSIELETRPDGPATDKLAAVAGGEPAGERSQRMPSGRRGARAVAVQALYESDVTGHSAAAAIARLSAEAALSPANTALAGEIVAYADGHRSGLDQAIAGAAPRFPAGQIAAVDRSVLRAALAEAAVRPATAKGIVASEAVEIARLFGADASPGFVNAVLGALLG